MRVTLGGGSSSFLLPEAGFTASHLLYGHVGKVTQGVSWDVEVGCYWLLSSLVLDVTAVSIEVDIEGVLRFSHIRTASCISCTR